MPFLLDACVVCRLQDTGQLGVLAGLSPRPVVVEEVWDELASPPTQKPAVLALAHAITARIGDFDVRPIPLGSPAAATFALLRARAKSPRDRGEDASIALASHDRDLHFVTGDVAASFRALAELPGRVLAFHQFLRCLHEQHDVPKAVLAAAGAVPSIPSPTWWAPWLAS